MTEPGTPEFYLPPVPVDLGDPSTDPPMVCRIEPGAYDLDPNACRVMNTVADAEFPICTWVIMSGSYVAPDSSWHGPGYGLSDQLVADWPYQHPIAYTAAFAHTNHRSRQRRARELTQLGDMDVDAFKGDI